MKVGERALEDAITGSLVKSGGFASASGHEAAMGSRLRSDPWSGYRRTLIDNWTLTPLPVTDPFPGGELAEAEWTGTWSGTCNPITEFTLKANAEGLQ